MVRFVHTLFICTALLLPIGCSKKDEPVKPAAVSQEKPSAQTLGLMAVVPDNVLAFAAGSGCDNLKPAFEKSIPGRIWNDPEVQTFLQAMTGQLVSKVKQEIPVGQDVPDPNTLLSLAKSVLSRPIIAGAATKENEDGLPVYGFLILDAGSKKAEIAAAIAKLQALDKEGDIVEIEVGSLKMHGPAENHGVPGYWGWVDNYFVFAVNDGEGLAIKRLQQPRTAAPENIRQVPTVNDIFALFVDCRKVAEVAEIVADRESATDMLPLVTTVLDKLGLKNVASLTSSARFAGSNLVFTESMETPAPHTGLLASLKPVNLKMFDMVDARAVRAGAVNCDIAGIYDTVMDTLKTAAPAPIFAQIETAIAAVQSQIQIDIRKDILGAFTGSAVFYSVPASLIMEAPGGGFVGIAEIKDAAALEKILAFFAQFANAAGEGTLQITSKTQDDGRTLHTCVVAQLAMLQVMPCWMLVDDHILIASNPPLHKLALARLTSPKTAPESIRSTEGFKKAVANLPDNLTFFSYADSKVQSKQLLLTMQGMWPMVNMLAMGAGIKLPLMLPSLTDIIEDIEPSVQYSWFDENGLHSIYRGSGIEPAIGGAAGGAIGAAIMMPALARTRQVAYRLHSGTNLSSIGKACLIYANDYDDKFPPNLQELIEKCDLTPKTLESRRKPKGFDGPSYIYVSGQTTADELENVLAYENPTFLSDGINVVHVDGHTAFVKPDEFLRELEATYKRLGREMPETKFKEKSSSSPFQFLR